MNITTRMATEEDFGFAYQLKKAAEYGPIKAVFGWDEVLQQKLHRQEWSECKPILILSDGEPIGSFLVKESEEHLYFGRFFLFPECHGRGIGSAILADVTKHADQQQLTCRLDYLQGNRVGRLYERYGFKKVSENSQFIFMERKPNTCG